jgi:hypothetical protein
MEFKNALEDCPVQSSKELSKILFFLGVTFKKLGFDNNALRCWITSCKAHKQTYSNKMVERFSNQYGMRKQDTNNMDDWRAFYSIQLSRYLNKKPSKRIDSVAERDMIRDLISDYWEAMLVSGCMECKTGEEKLDLFNSIKIIFPHYEVPNEDVVSVIPVNFASKTVLETSDRCFCGSGLQYGMCCGRTQGEDELIHGIF